MNDHVRELFGTTWLAAVLFAVGFVMLDFFYGWQGLVNLKPGFLGAVALVVTPLLWWRLISRHPLAAPARGAVVGVACAVAIVMLPTLVLAAASLVTTPPNVARAGSLVRLAAVAIVWTGVVPLGAALGALAVIIRKSQTDPPPTA